MIHAIYLVFGQTGHSTAPFVSEKELAGQAIQSWDLSKESKDARLSDQIKHWTSDSDPSSASKAVILKASAPTPLKAKLEKAVNQLRLGDFLTGVEPAKTELQVQALYEKMDPSDSTGWRRRIALLARHPKASTKQQQLKEISSFRKMLEDELTTTPSGDSKSAKQLRKSLRELLQRRQQLRAELGAGEDGVLQQRGGAGLWTRAVRPDPSQNEDILRRLSRPADRTASYAAWLGATADGTGAAGASGSAGAPKLPPATRATGREPA